MRIRRPSTQLRLIPAFVSALLAVAAPFAAWAHGDVDLQIQAVSREIQKNPNDAQLYLKRAELHRLHEAPDAALADLVKAREADPKNTEIDFAEGRTLLSARRFAEARSALDTFLMKEPDHVIALWFRAQTLMELGQRSAADADLKRCIELAPNPGPELILARARNLAADEKTTAGLKVLDNAIEELGPVPSLQLAAVELEVALARHEAALKRLEGMIGKSARPAGLLIRKAEVLTKAGNTAAARETYLAARKAIEELSPTTQKTQANRALLEKIEQGLNGLENLDGTKTE